MMAGTMVVVTPNTLPKEYEALGIVRGFDPSPPERLRMAISGEGGLGKSTLVNGIPNCLVLDFDAGSHSVLRPLAHRILIKNYKHYLDIMDFLIGQSEKGQRVFNQVAIDSVNKWSQMLDSMLAESKSNPDRDKLYTTMADYGDKGAGWALLRTRCLHDLNALWDAGYAWIAVCHSSEKEITVNDKPQIVIRPSIFKSLVDEIYNGADLVGEVRRVTTILRENVSRTIVDPRTKQERTFTTPIEKPVTVCLLEVEPKGVTVKVKRRLPTVAGDVILPHPVTGDHSAWEAFVRFYTEKIEEARKALATNGAGASASALKEEV